MTSLIAIVGPTAVGKSELAIRLAKRFNGEIINADSRQVYRFMDIGTAKPDTQDLKALPYHLINIIDPDKSFSLSLYHELALRLINDLSLKGNIPFLVGGTGQYIWALLEGWAVPNIPPDREFREAMEIKAKEKGAMALYEELQSKDSDAAKRIMPTNTRRIIRALEIIKYSREKTSYKKVKPSFNYLIIGLTADRSLLYEMIDKRVDKMINSGFVEEVKSLLNMGYDLGLPSMSGIGYQQIGRYLKEEISLKEAIQEIKYETHRFARKQYAWFRLQDNRIHWFDVSSDIEDNMNKLISEFLKIPDCRGT
jgi:tRNA dimethylallyltransferase